MKKYSLFLFVILLFLQGCLKTNAPLTSEKKVKCPNYLTGAWEHKEAGKPAAPSTRVNISVSGNCQGYFIVKNNKGANKKVPIKFANLKSGTYFSLLYKRKPQRYYIVRYSLASKNRLLIQLASHNSFVEKSIKNGTLKTIGVSGSKSIIINKNRKSFSNYINSHHKKIFSKTQVYVRASKRDIAETTVCGLGKLNQIQQGKCIRAKANNGFKQQAIIYHITSINHAYGALNSIQRHLKALGQRNASIVVVSHGSAAFILVNGSQDKRGRSFETFIQRLANKGVKFEISAQDIARKKITKTNLNLHARIVPSAEARIIDLQQKGYFYIKP